MAFVDFKALLNIKVYYLKMEIDILLFLIKVWIGKSKRSFLLDSKFDHKIIISSVKSHD